jgi:hypothetical protein
MNFEKFNLTEITDEQVTRLGKGVEIWEHEQDEQSQYVTMHGAERTLVLSVHEYVVDGRDERIFIRHFLMTLN